jgi:hypothetical protein
VPQFPQRRIEAMSKIRRIEFHGSYFWLVFWTVLFFPIAGIYFLLSSIVIEEDDIDADKFLEWCRSKRNKK